MTRASYAPLTTCGNTSSLRSSMTSPRRTKISSTPNSSTTLVQSGFHQIGIPSMMKELIKPCHCQCVGCMYSKPLDCFLPRLMLVNLHQFLCCSVDRWMGIDFEENGATPRILCLHASTDRKASDIKFWARCTNFNVTGNYTTKRDGTVLYTFNQAFTTTYMAARKESIYWAGTLSDDGDTLSGTWWYERDANQSYTFVYKHVGCKILSNGLQRLTTSMDNWGKEMGGEQLTNADREQLLLSVVDFQAELDSNHERCSYVLQDFRQRTDPVRW